MCVRPTPSSPSIVDRIADALDAQSLILVTAVIKAGEDHFAEQTSEETAVDYLNMLESLAIAANKGLVGPATASEIRSRIRMDVSLVERTMPGLMERATLQPSDFCEIRKVLAGDDVTVTCEDGFEVSGASSVVYSDEMRVLLREHGVELIGRNPDA